MGIIPITGYTRERSVAVHEAGHAVMAYLLGRPFTRISVVPDDTREGRVHSRLPGEWFRPDIEINARTRALIEDRVMIALAGSVTEAAWIAVQPDAPQDWEENVDTGAADDIGNAFDLASYMAGGDIVEMEAYVEWLRQRVLGCAGRGRDFDLTTRMPDAPPFVTTRYREGDDRFWALVGALATSVAEAGTLTWREARAIMHAADPIFAIPADGPFAGLSTSP